MQKETRQQRILSLIRAKRIGTQEELTTHLERAGVPGDAIEHLARPGRAWRRQASRLLRAAAKHERRGGARALSLDTAGDVLVVAKCDPGMASAVAVEIDRAAINEIVGTLAGEDTIFIAVKEQKAQRTAIKKIWELFG